MRTLMAITSLSLALLSTGCYVDGHRWNDGNRYDGPGAATYTDGFTLTWKLIDARYGGTDVRRAPALSCEAPGITEIQLDVADVDSGTTGSWQFPCDAGSGTTPSMPIGRYDVTINALDATAASRSRDAWTTDNSGTGDLGVVILPIDVG
jgi:hypothetical protein